MKPERLAFAIGSSLFLCVSWILLLGVRAPSIANERAARAVLVTPSDALDQKTRINHLPESPTSQPTLDALGISQTQTSVPAQATFDAMATRAHATLAPTKGASPVPRLVDATTNILLIGTDTRPTDPNWQPKTDVLMVAVIDTVNLRAALLSFPRDLAVAIPGHEAHRINFVYQFGIAKEGPPGGVALLKQVLHDEYGIRVDHWALIDFDGLQKIIDTLGGIKVKVACPLEDTIDEQHFVIPAGEIEMDYLTAKRYVQSRYSTSDTSRNVRQQRVLWAMVKKGFELNALDRIPELYDRLSHSIQTDMSVIDMLGFLPLVVQLDLNQHPERLRAEVLEPPAIYQWTSSEGAWLYMPNYTEIQKTLDALFDAPTIAPEEAESAECPEQPVLVPTDVMDTPGASQFSPEATPIPLQP